MARQIFIVSAQIVDSTGAFHYIEGYPKTFDSNNYDNDVDKAQKRADGDASEVWGAMCKQDTRMLQSVTLETVDGFQIYKRSMGSLNTEEPEQA